jgi:GNAT superfamily N-acetyltransferase
MKLSAKSATTDEIAPWRDMYRREMACQITHDSLHIRPGWTESYLLSAGNSVAGYGSIAIAGPWKGKPTVFEFYAMPEFRPIVFDLFSTLLSSSRAVMIEGQSNDPLFLVMIHTFGQNVASESILFHDIAVTRHSPPGAVVRRATPEDADGVRHHELASEAKWVVALDGEVAGAGDILYHYNRPYGDIYMKIAEPFRKRGLGSYLVQELKRICYQGGSVPAARCGPKNLNSRKTLQKAGFVPCGHILVGALPS